MYQKKEGKYINCINNTVFYRKHSLQNLSYHGPGVTYVAQTEKWALFSFSPHKKGDAENP